MVSFSSFTTLTKLDFSKKKPGDTNTLGLGGAFNALRLLVMGSSVGAGVPHSFATLGRACVLRRLSRGLDIEYIENH